VPGNAPPGKEVVPVSKRDKAGNTVPAATGMAERAAGIPYAQAEGGAEKKKADLKPAGEKPEGHRQEVRDGPRRWT
jgi:hypothetical protein